MGKANCPELNTDVFLCDGEKEPFVLENTRFDATLGATMLKNARLF